MRKVTKNLMEIHNLYRNENYESVDKMYEEVKDRYKRLKEDGNLNITKEKIRLYKKFNHFTGSNLKDTLSIIMIMMTSAIGITFQHEFSKANDKDISIIGLFIAIFIISIILIIPNRKIFIREKNEPIYYKICLEVLNEIEKVK